jgi:hypothetical protein
MPWRLYARLITRTAANKHKKTPPYSGGVLWLREKVSRTSGLPLGEEAILAEDGLAALLDRSRFERNLALRATLGTDGRVHFARRETLVLALLAAVLAALGSAQVAGVVELLLTFREGECLAAIATL